MIDRREILELAREFGLSANTVEKDYVLGWLLAGIYNLSELSKDWVFKGGTCLKKCFFETYRFSEDLDFTLLNPEHLNEQSLLKAFTEISAWVYDQSGIELPSSGLRFEIYQNPRGQLSAQGRVSYRGPLLNRGDLPRIKLDLTADEQLTLEPVSRRVHHPYSDQAEEGIHALCYSYEEIFAEKVRALAERERPRDLYDVVHLYRQANANTNRGLIFDTLKKKCAFKTIEVPTMASLQKEPERVELEAEWTNMLAHQLPFLPPFEQFWQELGRVLEWLYSIVPKPVAAAYPLSADVDPAWRPPAMAYPWGLGIPLEVIRYAGTNHLCVDLRYKGTTRLIEPYSLRMTKAGNLLLHALRHDSGDHRSYRVDEIEDAKVTGTTFIPKYAIELTSTGLVTAPETLRTAQRPQRDSSKARSPFGAPKSKKTTYGPIFVVQCSVCGKRFARKSYDISLNEHKTKSGYPCSGRVGFLVDTKY